MISLAIMVIVFVFNLGVYFRRIITLPDKEKVEEMINKKINNLKYLPPEEINSRIEKHRRECGSKEEIAMVKEQLAQHKEKTSEDIEIMKRGILEVRINLKNICEHLGVKYHNGNS